MTHEDIDFLVAERPRPLPLDSASTQQARQALLDHAHGGAGPRRGRPAGPLLASRRARPNRRHRLLGALVPLGLTAAMAAALVVVFSAGAPDRSQAGKRLTTAQTGGPMATGAKHQSDARSPLLRLAGYVASDTNQPGDATLILRTQRYPNQPTITGADLYTDSGQYFFSQDESGLPAAVSANQTVGNGFNKREQAAAIYAVNGDLSTARQRMANAALDPGADLKSNDATSARVVKQKLNALLATSSEPAQRATLQKLLAKLDAGKPLISPRAQTDNLVWENSLDTLEAGAGKPLVRAGVLRLLSTMSEVSVANSTTAGQPSLTLTAGPPALPDNYQEQLTINAKTGVPIRFTGGAPGQTPSVTATYSVARVSLAAVAAGHLPAAAQP